MKNTRIVILYYKLSFFVFVLLFESAFVIADRGGHLQSPNLSTFCSYFLPTNE